MDLGKWFVKEEFDKQRILGKKKKPPQGSSSEIKFLIFKLLLLFLPLKNSPNNETHRQEMFKYINGRKSIIGIWLKNLRHRINDFIFNKTVSWFTAKH